MSLKNTDHVDQIAQSFSDLSIESTEIVNNKGEDRYNENDEELKGTQRNTRTKNTSLEEVELTPLSFIVKNIEPENIRLISRGPIDHRDITR